MLGIPDIFILECAFIVFLSYFLTRAVKGFPKNKDDLHHKRLLFFDSLKGIAIISVIGIHLTNSIPESLFLKEILWFAVPLFIIESGYLLSIRHDKRLELGKYLAHIFIRIIAIYILFTIGIRLYLKQPMNAAEIIKDLAFGRINGNYYFIPVIIQFYVLFPLLIRLRTQIKRFYFFAGTAVISFAFHLLDHYLQTPEWNSNPYSLIFFGRFLIYFIFGMLLHDIDVSKIGMKDLKIILGIYTIGMTAMSLYVRKFYSTDFYPIMIMLLFLLIHNKTEEFHLTRINTSIIREIGKASLIIYLVHSRFQYDVFVPFYRDNISLFTHRHWIIIYLIGLAFITAISYIFARIFLLAYDNMISLIENKKS